MMTTAGYLQRRNKGQGSTRPQIPSIDLINLLLMVEMVASKTYIKATNSVAYLLGLACHQHRSPPNHKICMYILEIAVEVFSEADVRSSRRSSDLVKANVHHGSYCHWLTPM